MKKKNNLQERLFQLYLNLTHLYLIHLTEKDDDTLGSIPGIDKGTIGSFPENDQDMLGSLPENNEDALGSAPESYKTDVYVQ